MRYVVTTHTGPERGMGTDANITINITGTTGQSGPVELKKRFRNDFEHNRNDDFVLDLDDVGIPLFVEMKNDGAKLWPDWYLESVVVEKDGGSWTFPYNGWVCAKEAILIFEGTAALPQDVTHDAVQQARRAELDKRKSVYVWLEQAGLPARMREDNPEFFPKNEQFTRKKEAVFQHNPKKVTGLKSLIPILVSTRKDWDASKDMGKLFRGVDPPRVKDTWRDDLEFARGFKMGVAPNLLFRVRELPEKFPVTEALAGPHLEGKTLACALEQGRIYLVDTEILEGIPCFSSETETRYAPAAMCLLYVRDDDELAPVAIQLGQDPSAAPIFTPADTETDWLVAKLFVRCAEGSIHQIATHAVETHFSVEPFVMAMMRNLSSAHPVYKLCKRHVDFTLEINARAREILLAKGGVFDEFVSIGGPEAGHLQLATKSYANWDMMMAALPVNLERRDVMELPKYPFAEDGMLLWDAIRGYVDATLALYYPSDDVVVADTELQALYHELRTIGHRQGVMPFGDTITGLQQLSDIVTVAIFTSSAQHAAVNFLQFEHYAWVPNAPLCLRRPPPTEKGQLTESDLSDLLPSRNQCLGQLTIGFALSAYAPDEKFLLAESGWRERYFVEQGAADQVVAFQRKLREVAQTVDERNRDRAVSYTVLRPDRVPNSVAI